METNTFLCPLTELRTECVASRCRWWSFDGGNCIIPLGIDWIVTGLGEIFEDLSKMKVQS